MEILARAVGRRKEAVAQVQIRSGTGQFIINKKSAEDYLQINTYSLLKIASPFETLSNGLLIQKISDQNHKKVSKPSNESKSIRIQKEPKKEEMVVESLPNKPELLENVIENEKIDFQKFDTFVKVQGGGLTGQLDAIKLAVARALCKLEKIPSNSDENADKMKIRKILKTKGFLTQDSRVKERRKYGLKKARKAPQFSKR
jgi:small subunit ribosomal protein S9